MGAIDKEFSTITEVQIFCDLLEKNTNAYLLENPKRSYKGLSKCIIGEIYNTLEKGGDNALTEVNQFLMRLPIDIPALLDTIKKTRQEIEQLYSK